MIKNLNQLKRRLRPGTRLEVTGHCRPGCIGQLREVTWVNTQGVYTKILNPPDPRINAANDGRGSIMWWGAASTWSFEDRCVQFIYESNKDGGNADYGVPRFG